MKKRITIAAMTTFMMVYLLSSCYKNKTDILALPKVSFVKDVVPIMVGAPCGCHNNGSTRQVAFSHIDTIFYAAILARVDTLSDWVNGGIHPGGGAIDFSPSEKAIIKKWISEGAVDDRGGCTITGTLTFTRDIAPVYNTTCKGSICHGGIATPLTYAKMVEKKTVLSTMMNSGGAQGHPGGIISVGTCEANKFKEWIAQGQPQ